MDTIAIKKIKLILDPFVKKFNNSEFIINDPISVPHRFTSIQDIEIAGLFAAIFSWGNRKVIIDKASKLMQLMDYAPFQFVQDFNANDLKAFTHFKHRTFNFEDLKYFLYFLNNHYKKNKTLETAFNLGISPLSQNVEMGLINFYNYFISFDVNCTRTKKHVSSPLSNSSCKRLNMYLRWMVRNDKNGIDFGIWKTIKPSQLICPLDIHVTRVALKYGLISQETANWKTAIALTDNLKKMDKNDPVKYDFALFSIGVNGTKLENTNKK
jgi:uncharacterized protein (TIGR02757 family)